MGEVGGLTKKPKKKKKPQQKTPALGKDSAFYLSQAPNAGSLTGSCP